MLSHVSLHALSALSDAVLFLLELTVDELLVDAFFVEEFLVGALFDDFTVLEADNLVGSLDSCESMGDDNNCFAALLAQRINC